MYKNILVPVASDHAETTEEALNVARYLADEGARITALTVVEAIPGYIAAEIPDDIIQKTKDYALADLRGLAGTGIEPVVITGHAARSINDYAADNAVDCIVIASHRPGLADYFLGSTAHHVVRHAPCAVHVVR